jgi:ABC-type nickel/cobalt efflux system permease component RcnA
MDKNMAGLIGAVSAFAAVSPSQATMNPAIDVATVMRADSYADLLRPIPNAAKVLEAAADMQPVVVVQPQVVVPVPVVHHHHHHHHHARRVVVQTHHHHHHHNPTVVVTPP